MKDVFLVVLVLAREPQPTSRAFADAAREVLGPAARVQVEVVAEQPEDDEAVLAAGDADGVVKLSWSADESRAELHCYIARPERWIDRSITFSKEDLAEERGRMLGFAVASMFTEGAPEEPQPAPSPAPPPPPATQHAPANLPPAARDEPIPEPPASEHPALETGLEFAGVATTGVGGEADTLGALVALRSSMTEGLWARVTFSGRVGELPAAQANVYSLVGGVGAAWTWLETPAGIDSSLRADLLLSWLEVAHLSGDDATVHRRHRWLAGGDLLLGAEVHLSAATLLHVAGGTEGMLGKTNIYTHGSRVATIPVVRLVGELGVESRF